MEVQGLISGVVAYDEFEAFTTLVQSMLMGQRSALLAQVDEIERALKIDPTTAQIRRWYKEVDKPP